MNNDEHIANEIENIFNDAWANAPKIGDIGDLMKYLTESVNKSLDEIDALSYNLMIGKLTTVEGTDENPTKGALEIKILTTSDIPLNELLQDFTPKIDELGFIAVSNRNDFGSMTLIAFGNGHSYATCTENKGEPFAMQTYAETMEMFKRYENHKQIADQNKQMTDLFKRLHEIAAQ